MNANKEQTRTEVIQELRGYVHPSHYHEIIFWKTIFLRKLLDWYKDGNKLKKKDTLIAALYRISEDKVEEIPKRSEGLKRVMTFKSI